MKHADEHFIPGTSRITEIECFHRYHAVSVLCRDCRVLDAACGDGYGSDILARKAALTVGIDQDHQTVSEASAKYPGEKLTFIPGDVEEMPFENASFDRVVSFETIEHLIDQRKFLSEVRRVLTPEGVLILSSPNKTPFRTRNRGENIYHINELEPEQLIDLLREFFPNIAVYGQDAFYNSVITGIGKNAYLVRDSENNVLEQENLSNVQYTIILASAGELPQLPPSSFVDAVFQPDKGYVWDDESVPLQLGLRGEFEKQYAELTRTRELNESLSKTHEHQQETCEKQQQLIEELQQKNQSLSGEKNAKNEENARLAQIIENVGQINQRLWEENQAGSARIESVQLENQRLAEEKNLQEREIAQQNLTIRELEVRHEQLAERSRLQTDENIKQAGIIESMQLENQRLAGDITSLSSRYEALTKAVEELKQLNADLVQEKDSVQKLCGERARTIEELKQLYADLTQEENAARELCKEQKQTIEELKQFNTLLTQEKNSVQKLCEEKNQTINELETVNQALLEAERDSAADKSRLTLLVSQAEQLNRKLRDEIVSRQLENRELSQMIDQVKKMNEQLSEEQKNLSAGNEAQQKVISELQQHLAELSQMLEEKSAAMDALSSQCEKLSSDKEQLEAQVWDLTTRWLDEHRKAEELHNKSEYLWGEWQAVRNSLSYRLLGKFGIRRKISAALSAAAGFFSDLLRRLVRRIPMRYSRREALKNFIYSRCGFLLGSTVCRQHWNHHAELRRRFSPKGDTGLIMPPEIPLTSIVIPVYNNLAWTKRCVNSIYNIKSRSPFEVIVVDDCSTEDYTALIKDFPHVRLFRNEENLGFLRTVNYGVSQAQGEYILILNNDTEVLPNWLDELTTALYNHPEAGMIGSQLIHLNTGTLQESGNLICRNGDMMPLGRGCDPDHPQFTYFREVDFCSAASIILRKKVFDEMDGFDRIYAPAYFEDPDLGLRMQKAGYKNYVCPLSRVIHQEMASYGDVLAEKCERNRQLFLERWLPYLNEHALYSDRSEPEQCMKFDSERVLFIDAETPMADRGSGGMDSIFFMEYLIKRGQHVVFHGEYTPGYDPKYTAILLRMGVECIYQPYHKIWEYLASTGWSFTYLFICRIYQARCFDRLLKQYCPQASYIFDTVDVHFVRETLEAELKNDDALRKIAADTKKYELAAAAAADAAIVISSDEKKLLENEYGLTNIWHIPQARELFGLAPNQNRRGAVFIGSAHPPNLDGLRYFHDEILPLLPADFKLTIIGESLKVMIGKSNEYKDLLKCGQFNFVGFVQDLGTELDHTKITIAPLRYGAGTKGKVASSMAYGVPCVSSGFGTEGTGMVHGENIMIAREPQEFADYIKKLFEDQELWQKISDGGIKFIKDNYAPETVEKMMDELFAKVRERRRNGLSKWYETPVMPKVDEV